jgi:NAD/NADP transhydrogenase beta subunit
MGTIMYYILCGILSVSILFGISLMSKVKAAVTGNLISSVATALAIIITLWYQEIFTETMALTIIFICIAIGSLIGLYLSKKVKMIQMPELVALLNGVGGAASALVGGITLFYSNTQFEITTAIIALIIGCLTLVGSLIAAGKLAKIINGRPVIFPFHQFLTLFTAVLLFGIIVMTFFVESPTIFLIAAVVLSSFFGLVFAIRIGGADMPITISLLNSLSGVAGSIAGMAIGDILLVAVGGIVGASGLLLTQIMCRAMNRKLTEILFGQVKKKNLNKPTVSTKEPEVKVKQTVDTSDILKSAKKAIIVPGYGMALAQAQHLVKQLANQLENNGAEVKYAIHPVAGRMPGHMNVLLAEADVDYDQLYEMEVINDEFKDCDVCIVVGANDVINPAAREAEGTPIYGMPILNVDQAKHVIICNYDLKPGYAGVENPLYDNNENITLCLGDAKDTLQTLIADASAKVEVKSESNLQGVLKSAKKAIIVPGYGMALAQAQHLVKQLANQLENNGAEVKYAIHPVAGRMPGHMNVLLAEADVDYDQLYEMEVINDEFKDCDVCIVVGANDVINPAARESEGTPIYGMPILNVDQAKHVIICNYDLKPGYAGVENPLYDNNENITLCLGDAKDTLQTLIADASAKVEVKSESNLQGVLKSAKKAIIVPGYGMALAQAQHLVKQLANQLENNGAKVKYAIHPVAGRMPGHMNVLLAEADVDYDQLYEMEVINDEFKDCDVCIVVGANDVINPAAREAEGTPIYGMPILNVDQAKHVIIFNYDLKPGYAGVENPLYNNNDNITLCLGDAKETLTQLIEL